MKNLNVYSFKNILYLLTNGDKLLLDSQVFRE